MAEPQILVIDTTAAEAALELRCGPSVIAARGLDPAPHCQTLISGLKRLLKDNGRNWTDVDALAINLGPGSFTGIRVALAAAKAIAYVVGQKLIGVDQFDAFAANLIDHEGQQLYVLVEGQLQSVIVVRYERREGTIWRKELHSLPKDQIATQFNLSIPFAGPVPRFALPNGAIWLDWKPRLGEIAHSRFLAGQFDNVFSLEPFYVRPSSAEEKWAARTNG